ncbi:MAG: Type secretion lipoprotein VasD, EvfM, TssJ [Pseudomonadota bacterium]|jgi:type VI secretion system VasD/TssJ family lipoprotein
MFYNLHHHVLRRALAALITLGGATMAEGCAGAAPVRCDKTEAITLRAFPSAQLNPDREGYARSVVVRLFQLKAARDFQASSFEDVWALPLPAAQAARPDEWIVLPGRPASRALRRDPAAGYLAIAANFREHRAGSGWRALMQLPPARNLCVGDPRPAPKRLDIVLSNYALRIR